MKKSMDTNVLTAIISPSASAAVAITALILNSRGFASLENRMTALENRMTAMETRIHSDLQEFYRILTDHDRRIQRLEDKK
jgi:hypothetical protein